MSEAKFSIEPFHTKDVAVVVGIIVDGLTEHYGFYLPHLNHDLEDFVGSYGDSFILVAKQNSLIVGTGVLQPTGTETARIVRMSVRQGHRRLGIGSQILNALVQIARQHGFLNITLETTASWTSVVEFYERHHFVPTHQEDGNQYFARDVSEA